MTNQLVIWCRCGVDIDVQPIVLISKFCLKFEFRLKVGVILPRMFVRSMTLMGCLTFKLEIFSI